MQPEQHPCLYVPLELYVDLFPVPIFIYRLIVLTKFNAFLISTNHFSLIFGLSYQNHEKGEQTIFELS